MRQPNRKAPLLARCLLLAVLAAGPAMAQSVVSDLNGDGRAETFTLTGMDDGRADLTIDGGSSRIVARDIAWAGGIGQKPELSLAPNGSVRLTSMNEAIGRNRWRLTLTIAYREGAYRVAGYTYSWYDTLNLPDRGTCDLNLLTGRGVLTLAERPERAVRTDLRARPVTDWTDDAPRPAACRDG